jgi:NADH:ubiquinone oxidoreductase subunit 3 (subunit A)
MQGRTKRGGMQALSGLGWALSIIGLLVLTIALVQAVFVALAAARLAEAGMGLLLLIAGHVLVIVGRRSSWDDRESAFASTSISREASRIIFTVSWIVNAVGLVILGLGVGLLVGVHLGTGALAVIGLGVTFLVVGVSGIVVARWWARRTTVPVQFKY